MITPYGRIYASMYDGSMYGKSALHFAVMGFAIAKQVPESREPDSPMFVDLNPEALAHLFNDKLEAVEAVIEYLCSPDPSSRTKVEKGRRLVREGQFRYRVVNGRHYRNLADAERRKEINRKAAARYRARQVCKAAGILEAGEREYMAAFDRNASEEELGKIVERHTQMKLEARKEKKVGSHTEGVKVGRET